MKQTKLCTKIVKIARCLGINMSLCIPPFKILRTRAGSIQRSCGAWSWWLEDSEGRSICGSAYSATEIAYAPYISILNRRGIGLEPELFPEDKLEKGTYKNG